jgi:hypothetical protein
MPTNENTSLEHSRLLMKIIAHNGFWWVEEHDRLVRKYIAEHKSDNEGKRERGRLLARLRLEFTAWKYASRELRKHQHDLHRLYVGS